MRTGRPRLTEEQRAARISIVERRKAAKKAKGTAYGPAPVRKYSDPGMPSDLSPSEQRHWHIFADLLRDRGQLAIDSGPSLRKFAEIAAEDERLNLDVREHGMVVTLYERRDPSDPTSPMVVFQQTIRAEYKLLREVRRDYERWLCHFGLTDATRGKVSANPAVAKDPADEFVS